MPRHFLTLLDFSREELLALIARASELKTMRRNGLQYQPLKNCVLAMIFEKSSTRTRVSFEAAMAQFGGNTIFLSPRDSQLGRGEPIEDTARVLSGMVDCVTIRTFAHAKVEQFARYAQVPVINALTDLCHPCQLLADMQTFIEHRGSIRGKKVAWIGDGNNMCHSYIHAAQQFDFTLAIATPPEYPPNPEVVASGGQHIILTTDPQSAIQDADLVSTDVWTSMGQEDEQIQRAQAFIPYQVNAQLMALAKPEALFMHCLPAHRGEEVTAEVIDGKQSIVWEQAENRLHSQKALLEFLLVG
ncbi:MAG: ornithine carbamoyltransferase [Beggiatoa sp. IS2]|nr:MAG: ornithine carbamoyltransferase [Beggiatoa sp. IS2]